MRSALLFLAVITMMASFRYLAATRELRSMKDEILEKAAAAHSLLETAVPRVVASALLAGTPAHELTHSVASATVAFIALSEEAHVDSSAVDERNVDPTVRITLL
jgi:hypothetical protein